MRDAVAYRAALRLAIEDLVLERYIHEGCEREETIDQIEADYIRQATAAQGDVERMRFAEYSPEPPDVGDTVVVTSGALVGEEGVVIELRGKAKDVVIELVDGMVQLKMSQVRKKS